jgi:hypothetical protein
MIHHVGLREIKDPVPFRQVKHSLDNVYPAFLQFMDNVRPRSQAKFDIEPHFPRNGPGERDIVSGRPARIVKILKWRVIVVSTHDDGSVGGKFKTRKRPGMQAFGMPVDVAVFVGGGHGRGRDPGCASAWGISM